MPYPRLPSPPSRCEARRQWHTYRRHAPWRRNRHNGRNRRQADEVFPRQDTFQFGIPGHRLVAVEGIAAADANVAETRICIEILQPAVDLIKYIDGCTVPEIIRLIEWSRRDHFCSPPPHGSGSGINKQGILLSHGIRVADVIVGSVESAIYSLDRIPPPSGVKGYVDPPLIEGDISQTLFKILLKHRGSFLLLYLAQGWKETRATPTSAPRE